MSQPVIITSAPDQSAALRYLAERISDSSLINYLGADLLTRECGGIAVVTTVPPSPGAELGAGIGGQAGPCRDWLVETVISYIQRHRHAAVLFEDPDSHPSDPYLSTQEHPPFWQYEGRLFWPVATPSAEFSRVERVQAWGTGIREIICFVALPFDPSAALAPRTLSEQEFGAIASSLRRVVTDVFDGEGYLEWTRRA